MLGAAPPAIAEAAAATAEAAERATACSAAPVDAALDPPTRHAARKRRRGRRMVAVAIGIVAAGALAFVGATIANADRVVEVPRVTGMTVPEARTLAPRRARRRGGRAARRRQRVYSESIAAGS